MNTSCTSKVFFYGAGECAREALARFREYGQPRPSFAGFLDNVKTGQYLGHDILPVEAAVGANGAIVITVKRLHDIADIHAKIRKTGMKNIYYYSDYKIELLFRRTTFLDDCCIFLPGDDILTQAEVHIADHCNLRCKGCAHFTPIFDDTLPDFSQILDDIRLLKSKFSHIIRFYLLGGEPFLNPALDKYTREIRAILPDTELCCVTNGLLVPKAQPHILRELSAQRILVEISEYAPTHRMIDAITARFTEFGIAYRIRSYTNKQKFNKPLTLNPDSQLPKLCISEGCVNIWRGKIARCPTLMYLDRFNKHFGTHLPTDGIFDLASCPDGQKLLALLQTPVPLCHYCVENPIDWGQCHIPPIVSDFTE